MPDFHCTCDSSALLLIDVQERFLPAIPAIDPSAVCGKACMLLLAGAELLELPTIVSRQYPQGLGDTLPALRAALPAQAQVHDKTAFSCLADTALRDALADLDRDHLIIAGIEAHVCVLATVADALHHGYEVLVASDGVASRDPAKAELARSAMRDLGALVLPVESILFRLQASAGDDRFKALSTLVR